VGSGLNQIQYVGETWAVSVGFESEVVNGTAVSVHASCVTGDSVVLRFIGSEVVAYGVNNENHGMAEFSIDGGEPQLADQYSPGRQPGVAFWHSPKLPHGEHTLTMRVAGKKREDARSRARIRPPGGVAANAVGRPLPSTHLGCRAARNARAARSRRRGDEGQRCHRTPHRAI